MLTGAQFLDYLMAGVTYGSIYAIVAIGFNIIYNSTGIINFAQGEFVMIGGMCAATFNGVWQWPLIPAIVAAVLLTMILGALIEMVFIRCLKQPGVLRMIIITIGLSILLREAALLLWGTDPRALPYFTGTASSSVNWLGASMSPQVLWVLATCGVIVIGLMGFFRYSSRGREMRACAVNRQAALLCGINVRNLVTLSFVLSAGIGALAGCVLAPITTMSYDTGTPLAIKGFTVAILGGLGNSGGAVAAGMILGILEALSGWKLDHAYKDIVAMVVLLLMLTVRPSGLFGRQDAGALKEF